MNLSQIVSNLKQIAAECGKVTSGNVSHRIANIEQGILNITYYLEHYCELGWHPASELPEEGSECVVYLENTKVYKYIFSKTSIYNGEWYYCGLHDEPQRIVGWCYPPNED